MAADRPDEFASIARLLRPLTGGDDAARNLADDVAVIATRPGYDLVVGKDAMIEGVHTLPETSPDLFARKLLRVNLSDLATKGAEAFGYFLAVSWPRRFGWDDRAAFAEGLRQDQETFGLRLLGGDTVVSDGALNASVTMLGWGTPGRTPSRAGARPGDLIVVSVGIGDGWLGLKAARGELGALEDARVEALKRHYELPEPRVALGRAIRDHVSAVADVSDGLVADVGHIAAASGVGVDLDLARIPLSGAARAWLDHRADPVVARADLATGGDDYQLVAAVRPDQLALLERAAERAGDPMVVIGRVREGSGVACFHDTELVDVVNGGWTHG